MGAFTAEDREAFVAAGFAEMKAVLQLKKVQEKHWPAVESALYKTAEARSARRTAVTQMFTRAAKANQTPDVSTRLSEFAKSLRSRADEVEQLAKAAKPLLASLDESQQRRFGMLLARNRQVKAQARRRVCLTRLVNRQVSAASSRS